MYLCFEALLCHVGKGALILLQEGFAPAFQMLTAECCGLQDEGHTAGMVHDRDSVLMLLPDASAGAGARASATTNSARREQKVIPS